jgi:hypothetical protein
MLGYRRIPENWKSGIPAIAESKFDYTDFNFNSIVESTEKRALALIRATGGTVAGDSVEVKTQKPKPLNVRLWDDYGSPRERIKSADARWRWTGDWRQDSRTGQRTTGTAGAEAQIEFEGTGAILEGTYLPQGGTATIYLDGKLDRTVDVCSDENSNRTGESVWHVFGLSNGKHVVRLVVAGKPGPGSSKTDVVLEALITFR